jgi:zinc transport system substrate-binding protein
VREGARIKIVTSIFPFADLARRVGGDRVEVISLVPPGASEHTWEPTPRLVANVIGTRVFYRVGAGFEPWVEKLLEASGSTFVTVDGSEGVDLLHETATSANPHYWLDPLAMKAGVTRLVVVLAGLDPDHASDYRARGARTLADLDALSAEILGRTSRFASRRLVTFHEAWDYFARRYGLTVAGTLEEFPGKEPGPRHLAALVRTIREENIRAVFAEPQFSSKAADVVAQECGIPVRLLDPLGGEGVPGRSDYDSLMRYNVSVMEDVLE